MRACAYARECPWRIVTRSPEEYLKAYTPRPKERNSNKNVQHTPQYFLSGDLYARAGPTSRPDCKSQRCLSLSWFSPINDITRNEMTRHAGKRCSNLRRDGKFPFFVLSCGRREPRLINCALENARLQMKMRGDAAFILTKRLAERQRKRERERFPYGIFLFVTKIAMCALRRKLPSRSLAIRNLTTGRGEEGGTGTHLRDSPRAPIAGNSFRPSGSEPAIL